MTPVSACVSPRRLKLERSVQFHFALAPIKFEDHRPMAVKADDLQICGRFRYVHTESQVKADGMIPMDFEYI